METTPDVASIEMMRDGQLISEVDYQRILENIRSAGLSPEEALLNHVAPDVVAFAKRGMECGVSSVRLENIEPEPETTSKMPAGFAYKNKIVPIRLDGNTLTVAMADVLDVMLIDEIRLVTECEIEPVLATDEDVEAAIIRIYGKTAGAILSEGIRGPVGAVSTLRRETIDDFGIDEKDLSQDPTVVHAVDQMIIDAVRLNASDIHIEPFPGELKVRFRIDGVLEDQPQPPPHLQSAITSRVKIMAGMNVAERRRPQDGKIGVTVGSVGNRQIDLRVSTVPTVSTPQGESLVLRILDKQSISFGLEELGLTADNLAHFERLIRKPHGIILATGPTGSGKTTTLYACLKKINTPEVKIITIEEPVEYELEGINQIQVNPDIDVTFAAGLRHILRQDPDKVLVGEIRDYETAEMAIHTSLTGHLVFSTLHTNDAPGAITRLIDMQVESYLVASTIEGVIAQRLARRVCQNCCEMYHPLEHQLNEFFGHNEYEIESSLLIPKAVGCNECRDRGYKGRIGIFEILVMSEELRSMTPQHTSTNQLRRAAIKDGMKTLREDGWNKVVAGHTTMDEIIRLTQEDEIGVEQIA
ncbi:MAG: ATPase, T2SS/T4P/T4SS family [Candidatus Poribacteria bacterium]|nr:ATPase, T2SS/T4P/T4SS family [Candidatus Poribacteria bacterium]MDE0505560.1 ATPase, T2SS/T4P/T4SS family [Candidatus Poribacteria bacterium]